jgi:hypothetical protein
VNEDLRLVGGFAYVSKRGGTILHDTQGDSIDGDVLREAVHEFMKTGRTMGIMHARADGKPVSAGEVVEMAVFAGDFRPAGMDPDLDGLWIVTKVQDDEVWAMVKGGLLTGFSIGGKAVREPVDA